MEPSHARRRDIDGLRAVAVGAIVVYHAFPTWLPGGFVGVDIFFVISGYLITRILADSRDSGRFSWRGFYLRRARRIVPAYVVVALATALLAVVLELPGQLLETGAVLAASGLFGANILFSRVFEYFGPAAQQDPLLHLWSLGVEEQFYLVWPLLIVGLSLPLLRRRRAWLAAGLLVASLTLAQLLVTQHAGTAMLGGPFYGLPARAWEFLVGGVLSLGLLRPPTATGIANAAAATGLLLIAGSLVLLNDAVPFPGIAALPACLGAALILWGADGYEPMVATILSSSPVVALGRISYSFYLWHWPLFVLAAGLVQQPLGPSIRVGLVVSALALAAATWRFVEQRWRRGPLERPGRRLALTLSPLVLVIGVGAGLYVTDGLPGRLSPAARAAAALETDDINPLRDVCFDHAGPITATGCRIDAAPDAADYDVLVWGDSHADAITPGVVAWAKRRGWSVREAVQGGCPPLVGLRARLLPSYYELARCPVSTKLVLGEIAANRKLKLIVLAARWPLYRDIPPFYDVNSPRVAVDLLASPGVRPPLSESLRATLAVIATGTGSPQVLIVGPVPELTFVPPQCLAERLQLHLDPTACWTAPADLPLARSRPAEVEIRSALADYPAVRAIFPAARLCSEKTCITAIDGKLIYFDDDHLGAYGAERLVPGWMDEALAR